MRDNEDLFGGIRMSKEELKKKDIQMKILSMAKDKHRFNYKDEGYHMPDGYEDAKGRIDKAKREGALTARYEEEEEPKTEQVLHHEECSSLTIVCFSLVSSFVYITLIPSQRNFGNELEDIEFNAATLY